VKKRKHKPQIVKQGLLGHFLMLKIQGLASLGMFQEVKKILKEE